MSGELLRDLRQQIADGHALIVVGAGVSVGTTRGAPTASWTGLIDDGIARVEELAPNGLPDGWADLSRRQLAAGELNWLLSVAEDVTVRLGGSGGGEYRRWLRDAVGQLQPVNSAAIEALLALRAPIATTNYDSLIEKVAESQPVTWRDGARLQRVLRGDEDGILHLHGFWNEPRSVVLGIRSYEDVLRDGAVQALQQALAAIRSLVFVGFGAGLSDPNFAALRAWFAQRFSDSEYRHFRLCRASERDAIAVEHAREERILPIVYGDDHADLAPFLRSLRPTAPAAAASAPVVEPSPASASALPPTPMCVGRDAQLDELARDLADGSGPIVVLGPPGIGKSTVCVAAAHDERVAARYGDRRRFVRCDGATSAPALLAAIADVLGVSSSGGPDAPLARVLAMLEAEDTLIVLDNLETPWGHDARPTEELLARLAAVPSLTLVGAVRGAARPGGLRWDRLVTVVPLERDDARVVFLSIAGDDYTDDPHLDELLDELDGLPLAVELLAHAAQGEPDLDGLTRRWKTERVALLERHGGGDPALSVSASVEVSWTSPLMRPEGQQLLSLLGQLPDGVAHVDLESLLGDDAHAAASNARQMGLAFDAGDRLRVLAPIREHLADAHQPAAELDRRCASYYLALARTEGNAIGSTLRGGAALRRLSPETGNLNRVFGRADIKELDVDLRALLAVLHFVERTGNEMPAATARALETVEANADRHSVASVWETLGRVSLARFDLATATGRYERALALYEQLGDLRGQALCIARLGVIAVHASDLAVAAELAERALPLFEQMGDLHGEANCIHTLGQIALRSRDPATALDKFERALPLFERAGNAQGRANCLKGIGDIALARGEVSFAEEQFELAKVLYEQIGSLLGEANCLQRLGEAAYVQDDPERAHELLHAARAIFVQLRKPYSIGAVELALADLAQFDAERQQHVDTARAAWESIGRADLVARYLDPHGEGTP